MARAGARAGPLRPSLFAAPQVRLSASAANDLLALRMQPLHRLVEISGDDARQFVQSARDRIQHRFLVGHGRLAEHPGRDPVLVPRMADADAQAVECAGAEMLEDVAQSVLPAV